MIQKNSSFVETIKYKKYEIASVIVFLILFVFITFFFLGKQILSKSDIPSSGEIMTKETTTKKRPTIYPDKPATFPHSKTLSFTDIEKNPEYTNVWGGENMTVSETGVHVIYPKGSFSPSNGSIKGGGGFIYSPEFLSQTTHVQLSYTLTFPQDFDFVKGGKLPGLCGGTCPRGGNESVGFSTRFMWRKSGDLEVYGYFPGITEQSIERGMFRFEPGKTYHISQEIQINTPGQKDGTIKVFVDGKCIYKNTEMLYRTTPDILPNKMIFSTFFGGGDESWATPIDTSIDFSDFTLDWE